MFLGCLGFLLGLRRLNFQLNNLGGPFQCSCARLLSGLLLLCVRGFRFLELRLFCFLGVPASTVGMACLLEQFPLRRKLGALVPVCSNPLAEFGNICDIFGFAAAVGSILKHGIKSRLQANNLTLPGLPLARGVSEL